MHFLDGPLELLHDFSVVLAELHADDLRHVPLVLLKLLDLGVQRVLLELKALGLLPEDRGSDLGLEAVHGLLEEDEQAARTIQLIDKLVALLE